MISYEEARNIIEELRKKHRKVAIVTHKNADVDAIASAYVLSTFFEEGIVAITKGILTPAKIFAHRAGIRMHLLSKIEKDTPIIVVDSHSSLLLPGLEERDVELVIDHHQIDEETKIKAKHYLIDPDAKATAEEIFRLLREEEITPSIALILAAGIISDTARFKAGKPEIFEIFSYLLKKSGKTYDEILSLGCPELPGEMKAKIFEEARKGNVKLLKGYAVLFLYTEMSEAAVLSNILSDLFDLVFVMRKDEEGLKISARSKHHVPISLNVLMKEVGETFGGGGGGHKRASGCLCRHGSKEEIFSMIEEKLQEIL